MKCTMYCGLRMFTDNACDVSYFHRLDRFSRAPGSTRRNDDNDISGHHVTFGVIGQFHPAVWVQYPEHGGPVVRIEIIGKTIDHSLCNVLVQFFVFFKI